MMVNSSLGDFKTETKRKVEKIDLLFDDNIYGFKKFKCTFFPWVKLPQIKRQLIKHKFNGKLSEKDIRLFCKNVELTQEKKGFFDYYKIQPQSTIIINKNTNEQNIDNGVINPYQIFQRVPEQITNLLMNVQSGLSNGRKPKLASQGTSGAYFLENHLKKIVAVYKPFDQQPYAPNNPRNFVGELGTEGIRKGILSGECATREVAAYLLDRTHFHKVPPTTYVQFYHPSFSYKSLCDNHPICSKQEINLKTLRTKHGSLQQFVEYYDVVGNLGSHQFDVDQVHKIAILDLRILNCDRNEANILVVKKLLQGEKGKSIKLTNLVPIDHGLSFPDTLQIYDHQIVWMSYRQSEMPMTPKSLAFIQAIDPFRDEQTLRQKLGFREICLRNFRVAQIFLKKMAKAGFTLHQIGEYIYRKEDESSSEDSQEEEEKVVKSKKPQLSQLQKLVKQAETIFFTVKENGIKSTVQFQIGLIRHRRNQESLPELDQAKQINSQESKRLIKQEAKCFSKKNKETSIEKVEIISRAKDSPVINRNISLPNLIKKSSSMREKKAKLKRMKNPRELQKVKNGNEKWGDIFFHYFEDLLDRFVGEKLKCRKKSQPTGRGRLMSENIEM